MLFPCRLTLAGALLIGLTACGQKDPDHDPDHAAPGGHGHTAPHGGVLVELGEHAYNLEFLRDASAGRLTVWVLDTHAENFVRIKAPALELLVTVGTEKRPLFLPAVANRATGETVGDTSQFEAQADWLKSTAGIQGIIPLLEFRGVKFPGVAFALPPPAP